MENETEKKIHIFYFIPLFPENNKRISFYVINNKKENYILLSRSIQLFVISRLVNKPPDTGKTDYIEFNLF